MFSFTRQERQVILFLAALALFGIGADFIAKKSGSLKTILFLNPDTGKVDLNSADRDSLLGVPAIGPKLAQRIIEYRNQLGAFKAIEELKDVKGITDYRFQKIKDSFVISERKKSR
jgi:competence ComEA-like helix-hairpin-helix protein